ncbi:MBL fold metallo-hydrolase [Marinobacter halodurans]|uniref:MBL fold metallo-hydrolase n=1 Tax=Marinobacter halodurans TaxID=2528979 RepID=A0ABY1ZJN1_9GAMM|nr:MBL fold metallo-hydrolase [Marinobacter halodurans]TBW49837.1 MBL fold metallo-hydrolase [Marinobacter halodurans]
MHVIRNSLMALPLLALSASLAQAADTVRVTPLGGQDGEFCVLDRAMVFEDPNGTRILYDAGRTVAGADDPRLGRIDVVLVSHVHGDHMGDRHVPKPNAGSCASPAASEDDAPLSNSVKIAVKKDAHIVTGSEMASFFAGRLRAAGGNPKDSVLVRFGAHVEEGGVGITTVPAVHSNGLSPAFIEGQMSRIMAAAGLTAYVGPPTGYVLTFSNGLVVYLSGDTGITADQQAVVHDYYGAKLAVMNIGDTYTTGPAEAAHVINEMVRPASVIPSHANEPATENGKVRPGTRTEAFIQASEVPVHVPLSGRSMAFDAGGVCVEGCG